jgi:hypothetical protein
MFMVASSVVTTIMILNYHHRLADTHEMPEWVGSLCQNKKIPKLFFNFNFRGLLFHVGSLFDP